VWEYYEDHGAEQESDYPYTGVEGTCKYNSSLGVVATMQNNPYVQVNGSNGPMMTALNTKPASVTIEANRWVFQTYSSGIITSAACGTSDDHAVVINGYNTNGSTHYWIVRNSWGTSWGADGYVNIAMGSGYGICGINENVAQPFTRAWSG